MTTEDAQSAAGTAEGQGPVEIDEEMARHLANKREELFEKFGIPDAFPPEVLEEAEARTKDVHAEIQSEIDEREDLRDMTTWTTDPIDAQDFDDAISIEEREEEYVLRVHIADVTHYVNPETAMWDEAVERGNTVYLRPTRSTCSRRYSPKRSARSCPTRSALPTPSRCIWTRRTSATRR
jgi:ribonuclease R